MNKKFLDRWIFLPAINATVFSEIKSQFHLMYHEEPILDYSHGNTIHSDLNGQNLFHSAIDTPPGRSGGQKIQEIFLNMNFTV